MERKEITPMEVANEIFRVIEGDSYGEPSRYDVTEIEIGDYTFEVEYETKGIRVEHDDYDQYDRCYSYFSYDGIESLDIGSISVFANDIDVTDDFDKEFISEVIRIVKSFA